MEGICRTHTRGLCLLLGGLICTCLLAGWAGDATAQVRYSGSILSNPALHDGGLTPVIGVHCVQTMRANREHPDSAHCVMPWTYNHQPMLARWKGRLWMHYLSDPASEHVPPSQTFLQTSHDGYTWSAPRTLFPIYSDKAVMHQRIGWHVSSAKTGNRLLALGHYGICLNPKDDPNDGHGIGRVVREVHEDGTLGPIYFLYHNKEPKTPVTYRWPLYTQSKDKLFRKACEEILDDPLCWMGMVEECDRNDERLPIKSTYKAFCHYTLPDDTTIVGLWKHAFTSQSRDGGRTWSQPVHRAKGFVNSNAKIWGQRLSDGSYATVYNPSEYRWPLAISTSADGEEYTTLSLIHGEISPMRYGGQYKSRGPQYVVGARPDDGCKDLYVAYSMNKEDIWTARIPVPVRSVALEHANDNFSTDGTLDKWNIMSLVYAPVRVEGGRLMLADGDPHDYAKAERIIPATRLLDVEFSLECRQHGHSTLEMELLDSHGTACTRLVVERDSSLTIKTGARKNTLLHHMEQGREYTIRLQCDLGARMVTVWIDGKKFGPKMLFAPVDAVTRLAFRTGEKRYHPTPDTPADTPEGEDMTNAGEVLPQSVYYLNNVKTSPASTSKAQGYAAAPFDGLALMQAYCRRFNDMEPEGIIQAIPNSKAADWLEANIPFFECPDKQIEEMYYFRWWALRKAIRETPRGYVFNEFLVERSYADKHNMIACALGHHIMESRWLRNPIYIEQNVDMWLRGNDLSDSTKTLPSPLRLDTMPERRGKGWAPMWRLDTFSSWLPWAMWQRSLQQGSTDWMREYALDLQDDILRWEQSNSYGDGLFWQRDVKDGMEEQISGSRKQNNRRTTINSYMWGNYTAMARLHKDTPLGRLYQQKADALKVKIEEKLWSERLQFFCTLTTADTLAMVREQTGYMPWYFGMLETPRPDDAKARRDYMAAWRQLMDEQGFNAPFGITTAERRHPLFRKRFRPNHPSCEWDGAVWPFATSQTLTALANIMNSNGGNWSREAFLHHFAKYTESQYRRGRPYIGEYLDETNGQWLMGDRERSRYYNHSTYNDLVITALIGLRPSMEEAITVNPVIPATWDYFCIYALPYHGKLLTIFYDRDGTRYHQGKGLHIMAY